ncbi:hypothetical protein GOBAR_AA02887 [Gossypium barbadense]|uniref:F-box domain-containing protein n=1 Tax=Gossypium barbadense TaxID=3634 RepID=A0A2P5YPZ2_GOSBA|nr:hypothetical protein GOBAR_AA02887 [Gossypium barbadense]
MARIKTTLELEDRLSDLPDCLLHHIFGFIDFKYCIRTSVLSKRWKLLWTSLSNLYFDGCDGTRLPDFHRFVLEPLFRRGRHHNKYPLNEVRLHLMWMGTHSSFLKKNIAHLESHNMYDVLELRLHKCSISGKAVLNISCPRLVNLVLTDLKVHTRDPVDDKFKLIILAPQPVSFSLTLNRPLNFTALHLPALDNVEIQILSPNNFKTLSFSSLITMLQGLRYARSVKICSKTIEMLTMIPGALEKQSCPFSRLKNEDFESCR